MLHKAKVWNWCGTLGEGYEPQWILYPSEKSAYPKGHYHKNIGVSTMRVSRLLSFRLLLLVAAAWVSFVTYAAEDQLGQVEQSEFGFDLITVKVKQKDYRLEFANTLELRMQGLQYRRSMCETCGMIFRFNAERMAGMWMKNTHIPLDVAFINAEGKITDIKAMQPLDLTTVASSQPVLWAWEMNQGWFAKNGIVEGDVVEFPSDAIAWD